MKSLRVSSQDKLFMTADLKKLHRLKSREYTKRGKTLKYKRLAEEFKIKYKIQAQKYLEKNVHDLRESNPGQAYSILKRMGAQPGDCIDTFTSQYFNFSALVFLKFSFNLNQCLNLLFFSHFLPNFKQS